MEMTPSSQVNLQKEYMLDNPTNMNGMIKLGGPSAAFVAAGQVSQGMLPCRESPIHQLILSVRRQLSEGSSASFPSMGHEKSGAPPVHAVTTVSIGKRALRPRAPVDMSLFMNRSFRVGWTPDGRIVHCGHTVFSEQQHQGNTVILPYTVVIEKCDTLACTKQAASSTQEEQTSSELSDTLKNILSDPFEALLTSSTMSIPRKENDDNEKAGWHDDRLPLWRVPRADRGALDEYLRFASLLKSLQGSLGKEGSSTSERRWKQRLVTPGQSTWVVQQAIALVDAMHGQEDHMIGRLSQGRAVTHSMLPPAELRRKVSPDS